MQKNKNETTNTIDDFPINASITSSEEPPPIDAQLMRKCSHILKPILDIGKLKKLKIGNSIGCIKCNNMLNTVTNEDDVDVENSEYFDYSHVNSMWLCLTCGVQSCGRFKNGHALKHYHTPHSDVHALSVNTTTFQVWCYVCDDDVDTSQSKPLLSVLEYLRKIHFVKPDSEPANSLVSIAPNNVSILQNISTNVNELQRIDSTLPRVRGLSNLGNTCFFNAVMQCLAQTPYIHELLESASKSGEVFELPGGKLKVNDDEEIDLPPVKGPLADFGDLTISLANTLAELRKPGTVVSPHKLFHQLTLKWPQFEGGDQHDSHELLRHLLEGVRNEDLMRYQKTIVAQIHYNNVPPSELQKLKCKFYNEQVKDRILLPEQVFRGFLVSTLTCQDCQHMSSRHESFLDISLPTNVEKSQPPIRGRSQRTNSPEQSPDITNNYNYQIIPPKNTVASPPSQPSKHQIKKEKEKEKKMKRMKKNINKRNRTDFNAMNASVSNSGADTDNNNNNNNRDDIADDGKKLNKECEPEMSKSASTISSGDSDADIEDNIFDDGSTSTITTEKEKSASSMAIFNNSINNSITNMHADTRDLLALNSSSDSGNVGSSPLHDEDLDNMIKENLEHRHLDTSNTSSSPILLPSAINNNNQSDDEMSELKPTTILTYNVYDELTISNEGGRKIIENLNCENGIFNNTVPPTNALNKMHINDANNNNNNANYQNNSSTPTTRPSTTTVKKLQRVRTHSHTDWGTTIAPRYQCQEGECSIQSCLNNFTVVEMMTGSNKVDCDACTERINGTTKPDTKAVSTNATKQFLISSPPAVLILHLKRFQVGPRFMFRKLSKQIDFPFLLDLAPFSGAKVKNLPNINRSQKKIMYALYGIVEHSGSMHGGHYTAYVKVRPKLAEDDPRWKFLPKGSKAELDQTDEQRLRLEDAINKARERERLRSTSGSGNMHDNCDKDSDDSTISSTSSAEDDDDDDDNDKEQLEETLEGAVGGSNVNENSDPTNLTEPIGNWYFVSDSSVREVKREQVASAQAYLLFYERIY